MYIDIKHFPGERQSFNILLCKAEGTEPFLEIKGCRIMQGQKGPFVSYPATKNEKTGKYWNHAYGSEAFNKAVMEKAQPLKTERRPPPPRRNDDNDAPF